MPWRWVHGEDGRRRIWVDPPKPAASAAKPEQKPAEKKPPEKKAPDKSVLSPQQQRKMREWEQQQLAAAQKRVAEVAALGRSTAYTALAARASRMRAMTGGGEAMRAQRERMMATKPQAAPPPPIDPASTGDDGRRNRDMLAARDKRKRRNDLIAKGKYAAVLRDMRKDQKASGGRYLNVKEYNDILALIKGQQDQNDTNWKSLVAKRDRLVAKGDYDGLTDLFDSDEYKKARAFEQDYLGQLAAYKRLTREMSADYSQFLSKAVMGAGATRLAGKTALAEAAQEKAFAQYRTAANSQIGESYRGRRDQMDFAEYGKIVDQYLRKLQLQQYWNARLSRQRHHQIGDTVMPYFQPSAVPWENPRPSEPRYENSQKRELTESVRRDLVKAGLDPKILDVLTDPNTLDVDRQEALYQVRDAMSKRLVSPKVPVGPANMPGADGKFWDATNSARDRDLYERILRQSAPTGLGLAAANLGQIPGGDTALTAMGIPLAGIGGLLRAGSVVVNGGRLFGGPARPVRPTPVQYQEARDRGGLAAVERLDQQFAEAKAKYETDLADYKKQEFFSEQAKFNEYQRTSDKYMSQGPMGWWKTLAAMTAYSQEPFDNDLLNFVSMSALDPLNYVSPLGWIGAGRSAIARAGGFAALKSFGGKAFAKEFYKMGTNKAYRRVVEMELDLTKRFGAKGSDAFYAEKTIEAIYAGGDAAEKAILNVADAFHVSPPEVRQLYARAFSAMEEHITKSGVKTARKDLGALRTESLELAARAKLKVAAAKGDLKVADDTARGRLAVGTEREATAARHRLTQQANLGTAKADEAAAVTDLRKHYGIGPTDDIDKFDVRSHRDQVGRDHPDTVRLRGEADGAKAAHAKVVSDGMAERSRLTAAKTTAWAKTSAEKAQRTVRRKEISDRVAAAVKRAEAKYQKARGEKSRLWADYQKAKSEHAAVMGLTKDAGHIDALRSARKQADALAAYRKVADTLDASKTASRVARIRQIGKRAWDEADKKYNKTSLDYGAAADAERLYRAQLAQAATASKAEVDRLTTEVAKSAKGASDAWEAQHAALRVRLNEARTRQGQAQRQLDILDQRAGDTLGAKDETVIATAERVAYEREINAYEAAATRVKAASDALFDLKNTTTNRQKAYHEFEAALEELRDFEDTVIENPSGQATLAGRLLSARIALDDARMVAGVRDIRGASVVADHVWKHQIERELGDVEVAMRLARRSGNMRRFAELKSARRYLQREQRLAEGKIVQADRIVHRYGRQVPDMVSRNRLLVKAPTFEAIREEQARDLYGKYLRMGAATDDPVPLTAAERAQHAVNESALKMATVDTTDPRIAAYGQTFDGMDLEHAVIAMDLVRGVPAYAEVRSAIIGQAYKALPAGSKYDEVIDLYRKAHLDSDVDMVKGYEAMDRRVQELFEQRGRMKRKGTIDAVQRGTKAPQKGADIEAVRNRDFALADVLDKVDAARDTGLSVYAYDDVRPLFRDSMLKRRNSQAVMKDAQELVAREGITFDEAFERVYPKHLRYQAEEWLRRHAYKMAASGASDEAIWAAFAQEQLAHDLFDPANAKGITTWQRKQLRQSLIDYGHVENPDDAASAAKALGGEIVLPKDAVRMVTGDEIAGLRVNIPAFVFPDGHAAVTLAGAPVQGLHRPHFPGATWQSGISIPESIADGPAGPATIAHEWFHALDQGHPGGPQRHAVDGLLDDVADPPPAKGAHYGNVKASADALAKAIGYGGQAGHEFLAEMYATWALGTRRGYTHLSVGMKPMLTWHEVRSIYATSHGPLLDKMEKVFGDLKPPTTSVYGVRGYLGPPFHSQAATYKWLEDNGFWSKRTGEDVAGGGQVWSLEAERKFFKERFAVEPTWTDPDVVREALKTKDSFDTYRRSGGFAENVAEVRSMFAASSAKELKDAQAFGNEALGMKASRSPEAMRKWMIERFGDIVYDKSTDTLKHAYWLMDPVARPAEYRAWLSEWVSGQVGRFIDMDAAEVAATKGMKDAHGITQRVRLPAGALRPDEIDAFSKAVTDVAERHIKVLLKRDGRDVVLHEVLLRAAADVVDELVATTPWRRFLDKAPAAKALSTIGFLQRAAVFAISVPFIVVNTVERFTFRPVVQQLVHSDINLLGPTDQHAHDVIGSMPGLNVNSTGVFEYRTRSAISLLKDPAASSRAKMMAFPKAVFEVPMVLASMGEDAMQLHVARRTFMGFRDDFLRAGVDPALATARAREMARKRVVELFALGEDAGEVEKAINALVPFFSYNIRTATLYLKMVGNHPGVILLGDRLGRYIETVNRDTWEREHPGVPFDEGNPDNRKIWIEINGHTYMVDLSQYSDTFRAGQKLTGDKAPDTVGEWFKRFVRIPHPLQEGFIAMLMGTEGPWGKVEPSDFFWPATLVAAFGKIGEDENGESLGYADMVEMVSSVFTWNRWERLDPIKRSATYYWSLIRSKQYGAADALLKADPSLKAFLQAKYDPQIGIRPPVSVAGSYFRWSTMEDKERIKSEMDEYRALQDEYERKMGAYADKPWDPSLRDLRRERRAVTNAFLVSHPDVMGVWAHGMSVGEWSEDMHELDIDDQMDEYFGYTESMRPLREKYAKGDKGELDYRRELRRFNAGRERWLDAHPEVEARLTYAATDLGHAWREFEADRAAAFDQANEIQIKILKEKLKEKPDYDVLDVLYEASSDVWNEINSDRMFLQEGQGGALSRLVNMPGLEALRRMRLSADEAKDYDNKQRYEKWYRDGMGTIINRIKDRGLEDKAAGRAFYRYLENHPDLMREYFFRNEEAKTRYDYNKKYIAALSPWVDAIKAQDWDRADRAFAALPDWVKNQYYKNNPDAKRKQREGTAYMAAMQRWIKFYDKGDREGARKYFINLPEWIKDRYFKAHPDKVYTLGTDLDLQSRLATYFMADDPNRARMMREDKELRAYLTKHNSDGARRAMVVAYYATLTDPWAKRVYREKYPEYFSEEAKAAARQRSLQEKLRKHPELREAWEEAVKIQTETYEKQLRLKGTRPPKPLDAEHISDLKKRRHRVRRRAARFSSHWMSHEELRHG